MTHTDRVKDHQAEADTVPEVHAAARDHIRARIKPGTVTALPSAPCTPPKIDMPVEAMETYRVRVMRLTCVAGYSGLPVMHWLGRQR